jgi:hypothetical protein
VAIIRISGADATRIAAAVFWPGGRFKFGWKPESHRVYYGTIVDGNGDVIDEAVLVPMLAPRFAGPGGGAMDRKISSRFTWVPWLVTIPANTLRGCP